MVVKIGVIKCGNIGTSPVIDLVLDERADRPNIDVRTVGSGAKMNPEQIEDAVPKIADFDPEFVVFISPNPGAPGPAKARELLSAMDIPAIIVGDAPGIRAKDEMDEQGLGYILVKADPMIGARRELLDPTEMASFNSDVLKVLAATGAYRVVQNTLDAVIAAAEAGSDIELPKVVISAEKAVDAAGFANPYAKAKALAAYTIAEKVADVDVKGCFMIYAVLSLGGFLTEKFSRSKFQVNETEGLIRAISKSSNPEEMKKKVRESELREDHKEIIIKIISNHGNKISYLWYGNPWNDSWREG